VLVSDKDLRAGIEALANGPDRTVGMNFMDAYIDLRGAIKALLAARPVQDEGFAKSGSNLAQSGSSEQVTTAVEWPPGRVVMSLSEEWATLPVGPDGSYDSGITRRSLAPLVGPVRRRYVTEWETISDLPTTGACPICQGTGGYWTEGWRRCPACAGTGRVAVTDTPTGAHLRVRPRPRYDAVLDGPDEPTECPDCGRTDGGCDRVVDHYEDYMCPNCVTPWKCNLPHIMEVGE